jgi:hypothetical protein
VWEVATVFAGLAFWAPTNLQDIADNVPGEEVWAGAESQNVALVQVEEVRVDAGEGEI